MKIYYSQSAIAKLTSLVPISTSVNTMPSGWVRGIFTVCHVTSRYNDMKTKNQVMASNVPTLLTLIILTGVVVACISSFIPNFLATFFFFKVPEKSPTLTGVNGHRGGTSIILRVRQKIPINPGENNFCHVNSSLIFSSNSQLPDY